MKLPHSSILSALRLASSLADTIPGRGDTPMQVGVKLVAMIDKALGHYGVMSEETRIRRIVKTHDLIHPPIPLIPWLLQRTRLFTMQGVAIKASSGGGRGGPRDPGENDEVHVGKMDGVGEVVFGSGFYLHLVEPVFVSRGFNVNEFRSALWALYPNGIHLGLNSSLCGPARDPWSFTELPAYETPISSRADKQLRMVVERMMAFAADKTARSYLLFGPQGTGKSGFGWRMGQAIGGRTLAVEAAALAEMNAQEFEMVVDALQPTLLLVDDVDGGDVSMAIARVRYVLTALRKHFPRMSIVLTANRTEGIDRALLRGERVDIPIEFPVPDAEERREILERHFALHGVAVPGDNGGIDGIVSKTESFPHADLVNVCIRAKQEPLVDVLANVKLLNELAARSSFGGTPMHHESPPLAPHATRMIPPGQ